jgi:hypothetical protein
MSSIEMFFLFKITQFPHNFAKARFSFVLVNVQGLFAAAAPRQFSVSAIGPAGSLRSSLFGRSERFFHSLHNAAATQAIHASQAAQKCHAFTARFYARQALLQRAGYGTSSGLYGSLWRNANTLKSAYTHGTVHVPGRRLFTRTWLKRNYLKELAEKRALQMDKEQTAEEIFRIKLIKKVKRVVSYLGLAGVMLYCSDLSSLKPLGLSAHTHPHTHTHTTLRTVHAHVLMRLVECLCSLTRLQACGETSKLALALWTLSLM